MAEIKKKGRGGARKGGGRPRKADEDKVRVLTLNAIKKEFGSEDGFWEYIAMKARESNFHLNLLTNYHLGKPIEQKKIEIDTDNTPQFTGIAIQVVKAEEITDNKEAPIE